MKKVGLFIGLLIVCVLTLSFQYNKIIQHPIKDGKDVHIRSYTCGRLGKVRRKIDLVANGEI